MSVNVPYQGGCSCGAIRYNCVEAPLAMFNCHCKDCQQASGGAFVTVALVREAALHVTSGQAKYHRVIGESGRWTDRGFCGECGTPLFAKGEIAPGYMTIKPGSLDDGSWYKPTIDTWAASAPAWLHQDPELPKADRTPRMLGGANNRDGK